jgi:hypothetical protein
LVRFSSPSSSPDFKANLVERPLKYYFLILLALFWFRFHAGDFFLIKRCIPSSCWWLAWTRLPIIFLLTIFFPSCACCSVRRFAYCIFYFARSVLDLIPSIPCLLILFKNLKPPLPFHLNLQVFLVFRGLLTTFLVLFSSIQLLLTSFLPIYCALLIIASKVKLF